MKKNTIYADSVSLNKCALLTRNVLSACVYVFGWLDERCFICKINYYYCYDRSCICRGLIF